MLINDDVILMTTTEITYKNIVASLLLQRNYIDADRLNSEQKRFIKKKLTFHKMLFSVISVRFRLMHPISIPLGEYKITQHAYGVHHALGTTNSALSSRCSRVICSILSP